MESNLDLAYNIGGGLAYGLLIASFLLIAALVFQPRQRR